jgi:hypothetical protein
MTRWRLEPLAIISAAWWKGAFAVVSDVDLTSFSPGPTSGWVGYGYGELSNMGVIFKPGGDFNGDGLPDALIGASQQHGGGSVYVVFGTNNFGTSAVDTANAAYPYSLPTGTGITIYSGINMDQCGAYLDGGADFNADGYDDVAIGCPGRSVTGSNAGSVFVVFGHGAPYADVNVNTMTQGSQGFVVNGLAASSMLSRVAFADANGDGLADLVAGAPAFVDDVQYGWTYVLFGTRSNAYQTVNVASFNFDGVVGFKLMGHTPDDRFGIFVSSVGDHNGDGYEDFAVQAPYATYNGRTNTGAVYVIFGHSSATAFVTNIDVETIPTATLKGYRVYGPSAGQGQVRQSASPGDLNGDGIGDLVLNTWWSADGAGSGSTYVLFGHSGTFSTIDLATFTFTSAVGYRIFGAYTNSGAVGNIAGDVNADGYDDIVVASIDSKADRAGSVTWYMLYSHGPSTPYSDVSLSSIATGVTTGYKIYSLVLPNGWTTIAGKVGDINGDGVDDVGVGLPSTNFLGRSQNGAAWLLLSPYPIVPTVSPSSQPTSQPSAQPSRQPAAHPSAQPSAQPSRQPSRQPSVRPSSRPSARPSARPTAQPSREPSTQPSAEPSVPPSAQPSARPSSQPSSVPSPCPSGQPSAQPFSQPSQRPTSQPTGLPTSPTSKPSSRPSSQPTAVHYESVLASPTYRVQNGFAFAAIGDGGAVRTWGEAAYGADSSAVQAALNQNVARVVASRFAYAAVKSDGSVAVWGSMNASGPILGATVTAHSLVAGEAAFAALEVGTGRVVATGSKHHGGNVLDDKYCNGYSAQLSAGVRSLTATIGAFAAIKADGSVYVWGNKFAGADVAQSLLATLAGTKFVVATRSAFAALLPDNRVATWGDAMAGGDSSAVAGQLQEVYHITASRSCFVAFKRNTGVVVWGYGKYGGDMSAVAAALSSGVTHVAHTRTAMAAVKADGMVVAWGRADTGGDSSAVQGSLTDVVRVVGNGHAFAALTSTGGVVAWGNPTYGGSIPGDKLSALSSGVVSVYHTDRAFAALKDDGSLVVWGQARHGGSPGATVEALLTAEVHTVCANDVAFSAIKADGSVVAWGHEVSVPADGLQFTATQLAAGAVCA